MPKKTLNRNGKNCRVTFSMPAEVRANEVYLCGEFNDWNQTSHPLKRRKDDSYSTTLTLETGRRYRYRFLLDGERWENDWEADGYAPNAFGIEDSVLQL